MSTIRILLGVICLAFFGGFIKPSGNFLRVTVDEELKSRISTFEYQLPTFNFKLLTLESKSQTQIIQIARSQLHVREATGHNDGVAVENYLQYTHIKKGAPWCASFVSWVFGQAGFKKPRTAWSPALFPIAKITKQPATANVFGIYFFHLKRIAHCGVIERVDGNWINSIEGNTNASNSRDGDGVYRKLRHKRTIAVYADWLN